MEERKGGLMEGEGVERGRGVRNKFKRAMPQKKKRMPRAGNRTIGNQQDEIMPPAPLPRPPHPPTHPPTSLTFLVRPPVRRTGTPPSSHSASGFRFGPRDGAAGARRRRTKTSASPSRGCPGRGRGAGRACVRGDDDARGARCCGPRGPRGPPLPESSRAGWRASVRGR